MKKLFLLLVLAAASIKAQQWNGLTIYCNMGSTTGYLIDTSSTNVKTWTFTGSTGYSTHMMPGGFIWRSVQNSGNILTGGGMHGRIQKLDYNGTILWDYTYSSGTYCLHHDHCPLPNGNVLVISYDVKNATDVYNAGATNSITVWSEKIMELQPVGTNSAIVVWEWKAWDHLVQNLYSTRSNYQTSIVNNPQLLNINYQQQKDWMHMNGVDYNPMLDQIALSSHNLNEWYIIDHSTTTSEAASHSGGNSGKGGDILYRWGNPLAYQASGTKILDVTHDAHWIPEDCPKAGYLAGLNNKGSTGPKTTADNIVIPLGNNYNYTITSGSAFTPSSYSNRHTSTGYTSNMGSTEQFPNGNQMICLATSGTIYEIDAAGNTLWSKSTGGMTPQSHRYTACYINNPAPAQPSITANSNTLTSTTGVTYQWYLNGILMSGETNQNITLTQNGIYVVRVTDSNGCVYAYSAGYPYGVSSGMKDLSGKQTIHLYPNPSSGILNIDASVFSGVPYEIWVHDAFGKLLMRAKNSDVIDLSEMNSGVYFVTISSEKTGTINKKISLIK